MRNFIFLLILSFFCSDSVLQAAVERFVGPLEFGAKADGQTLCTAAIQKAIDQCSDNGGGTVALTPGTYITGTIILKDNVTLQLDQGAILKGSNEITDFPILESNHLSYAGEPVTNRAIIYAEDAKNIAITGEGTLDGNGFFLANANKVRPDFEHPSFSYRPRIIHFRGCEHVRIRDITLTNTASWTQSYQSCRDLSITGIRVRCRENLFRKPAGTESQFHRNSDGLDLVDCQRVQIANCNIECGDDAICLKSFSTESKCSDIVITNCLVSSSSSGIKIGTETVGGFEDITISNCVIYDTNGDGIALLSVDGAFIQRVTVSNIVMRNVKLAPIVLRLGARDRLHRKNETAKTGLLRDIIISNIQGSGLSGYPCSITGVPGRTVENVIFRDINLEMAANGKKEDALKVIPENEKSYPKGGGMGPLPAYGLFIRHAKNITLENLQFRFTSNEERPALIADDVERLLIRHPNFQCSPNALGTLLWNNVRLGLISGAFIEETPLFLSVTGAKTASILLHSNVIFAKEQEQWFQAETETIRQQITVFP